MLAGLLAGGLGALPSAHAQTSTFTPGAGGSTRAEAAAPTATAPPATTDADIADVQARTAFRLGSEHYSQGRFPEAALEFERAYGLSGRAQLLFNAYLAYRDAQDEQNAARVLRGYLANVPEVADRAVLESRLAALDSQVREHQEREALTQAAADEAQRRIGEAEARAVAAAEAPRVREVPGETWPWAVLGVGGGMIAAGAVTGAIALSERSELDTGCPAQLCPNGFGLADRQAHIALLANTTDALLIGGGVTALTGLMLGILFGPHTEAVPASITTACSGEGCSVTVRGEL